ncbi:hypothetical protein MIR68_001632 [Amoeboaphelidium protococcarum]|nr:hypothetical protein MIR68_001632 [Amoeboaphelidium protococcarum]
MISILQWNIFMVPPVLINKVKYPTYSNKEFATDTRMSQIVSILRRYDIFALQESWGPEQHVLVDAVKSKYTLSPDIISESYTAGPSFLNKLLNSALHYWNGYGGLVIGFDRSKFKLEWSLARQFTVSQSSSKKGVRAACLQLQKDTTQRIVVINTHLDPDNEANKLQQLREIGQFISHDITQKIASYIDLDGKQVKAADCTILLCGDFNIGFGSEIYSQLGQLVDGQVHMRRLLNTNRDTYDPDGNLLATVKEAKGHIDHIFLIEKVEVQGVTTIFKTDIQAHSTVLSEFDDHPCPSDHYPLHTSIDI